MNGLSIIGVSGSIGRQTVEVARSIGVPVVGIGARNPSPALVDIARAHPDAAVAVSGGTNSERIEFSEQLVGRTIEFGPEALTALAARSPQTVMNAVVGLAGLPVTAAALQPGNRLALANKESLVAAGPLVRAKMAAANAELIPVDSEHSAIFQCLVGEPLEAIDRVILTASGGPFRGWQTEKLAVVTPREALNHPNWSMGRRITIDSATLVNKALEVIEAHHLFDIDFDRIEVVIHPQSVIHSMVRFSDGSVKAQLGPPDMRLPIELALTYPQRGPGLIEPYQWAGVNLSFETPDHESFPALALGYQAGRAGGSAPAVFNAADEVAVEAFLQGRLGFTGICDIIARTLEMVSIHPLDDLESVYEADREAREVAAGLIAGAC